MVPETEPRSIADFPDIIYHVVAYLDPGRPQLSHDAKLARQSLARLARTCRNFAGPALKTLWKRLPDDQSLADLLCVLGIARRHRTLDKATISELPPLEQCRIPLAPGQLEAVVQRWKMLRGFDDPYTLCGPGDPSTHPLWKRFEEYAAYVRTITGLFAFDGPKWCELWKELVPRIGPTPLLPYLQSVSFRPDRSRHEFTTGSFLLLSPSVTSLEYCGREYHNTLVHFAFSRAFDRAPEMEKIRIPVQPWEDMHTLGHRIRHVEVIPEVESKRLQHLAKFPYLRSLDISLKVNFDLEASELTFPLLDTLEAKGDWTDLTALLNATDAPNLRVLSLEVWQRGAPAQQVARFATECLHAISTKYPSLTSLTVLTNSGCPPLSYGYARTIPIMQDTFKGPLLDIIRPLLALHGLRALTLVLPNYLDIGCSSEDLLAMSEAWPDLEALHVVLWDYFTPKGMSPPPGAEERPRGGPFAAAAHFARNCPRLRTLHLPPMDATQLGVGDSEGLPHAHGLQSLIVSKLRIGLEAQGDPDQSTRQVPEFVKRVFPMAAWAFRKERVAVADGWVVAHENARCLDCDDLRMSARAF